MQDTDQLFIESYGGNVTMVECEACGHGVDEDTYASS